MCEILFYIILSVCFGSVHNVDSTCYFRMDCVSCNVHSMHLNAKQMRKEKASLVRWHLASTRVSCTCVVSGFWSILQSFSVLAWYYHGPPVLSWPCNVNVLQGTSSAFPSDLKLQWVFKALLYSPDPAMSRYFQCIADVNNESSGQTKISWKGMFLKNILWKEVDKSFAKKCEQCSCPIRQGARNIV